ncbi:group XIIA secretory phospholipase A2 [Periplaneta americana]|uniref:group XIIA secretory phospholipase A2 n=1 Tax=Periplaneta americana TaxID=6978 RepID=UPI0037E70446
MEIPKMKVFIYVLTFLGYAWSGYGAGIISNLKDAVLAAEHVFGDVLENIIIVAKKFKVVHEVFDAAVEEDCKYICPDGVKPVKNKYHWPSSNGCGSLGLEIPTEQLPVGEMTSCCNDHDICYDTCGQDKEQCDFDFKRCLYKICEKYEATAGATVTKGCKAAAKMLFTGTITLGCKSYLDCQAKACYCAPPKKKYTSGGEYGEL